MHGTIDSRPPQRFIGPAARAVFLAALRRGATREDAAAQAGFSLTGFYGRRRRDPAFAKNWADALAAPQAARRRARAYAERGAPGEIRIAPANRRIFQRRRRYVRFTAERRGEFLGHFAATGDAKASAAAVGVAISTVSYRRRVDRDFAVLYREAIAIAYGRLEALALSLALIAQARLRHAMETHGAPDARTAHAACPACGHRQDEQEAFDRAMRLLARLDRKQRKVETKFKPGGRRRHWTFEESIEALDKALRGLGIQIWGEEEREEIRPGTGNAQVARLAEGCRGQASPEHDRR